MDVRNRVTRLTLSKLSEQATNRKLKRERWPKKPTPSGKPKDMLTWAGCMGRPGYLMSKGLMTHVPDVVKTERSTNVRL